MNRIQLLALLLLCLTASSCLKTRSQLREDPEDDGRPQTVKPVAVEPKDAAHGQYVIDELKSELTRLNGRIEDLERAQRDAGKNADAQGKEDRKRLETRIQELEAAQANMLEAIKKLQETPAAPADPNELYARGKAQYDAANYEPAIEALSAYLKNPKAPKTEDATYLRAEAYYHLKQYKKAIVDYSKFPEKYTRSSKLPAVLFRIGQSFDALNMKEDAKGFYTELVEKFPKSPEAKKARPKLK